MIFWLVPTVLYSLAATVFARMAAGHFAYSFAMKGAANEIRNYPRIAVYKHANEAEPDGEQWFGAILLAFVLCFFWPLALCIARWPIKMGAEREAELKKREQALRELERELEL